jgi:hypothetical protein
MAVYRGPIRRLLHRPSRHSLFAGLLAKPGFNPNDVRAEMAGQVEHGLPGADPECRGSGAVALLVGRELGWVAPVAIDREPAGDSMIALPDRLDGWVKAAWVTAWSLAEDELTVDYVAPQVADPTGGGGGPRLLRITGDPAALADFVARAARVLSKRKRR